MMHAKFNKLGKEGNPATQHGRICSRIMVDTTNQDWKNLTPIFLKIMQQKIRYRTHLLNNTKWD